jgi:hypothetical protein
MLPLPVQKKEFYIVGDKKLYLNCGGDTLFDGLFAWRNF